MNLPGAISLMSPGTCAYIYYMCYVYCVCVYILRYPYSSGLARSHDSYSTRTMEMGCFLCTVKTARDSQNPKPIATTEPTVSNSGFTWTAGSCRYSDVVTRQMHGHCHECPGCTFQFATFCHYCSTTEINSWELLSGRNRCCSCVYLCHTKSFILKVNCRLLLGFVIEQMKHKPII